MWWNKRNLRRLGLAILIGLCLLLSACGVKLTEDELLWMFRGCGPWQTLDLLGSFGEGECTRALDLLADTVQSSGNPDELSQTLSNWGGGQNDLTPEGKNAYDYLLYLIEQN